MNDLGFSSSKQRYSDADIATQLRLLAEVSEPEEATTLLDAADRLSSETFDDLGAQIYALLVRRGYAQHEAHLIASGPGCTSDCVQKGYPDIECPEHGARAVKANGDQT